nr:ABC transporter permease [uncultured Cohaesibacter sp.]
MLREAALVQARVIGALILRETRVRFGRSQLGYLWALANPIAWIVVISMLFSLRGAAAPYGNNMGLFVALGVVPFRLYGEIASQCGNAIDANQALLNFPIVKELDSIIARAILEAATFILILFIITAGMIVFTGAPLPSNLLVIGEGLAGISLLGFGVGTINAVVSIKISSWMNFYKILATPLMWISGIFYSLESIPPVFRDILVWNPIIHGVEYVRLGYFQHYRDTHVSIAYLFACGIILTFVGLAAERVIRLR